MPSSFYYFIAFILGLAFGSFANVVIWRLPRDESLSYPASHCPACEVEIEKRDNIPVVSWLLLRGRCRSCGTAISIRYPLVELLSALLWLAAAFAFGPTIRGVFAAAFLYLLLVLSFIDLDTLRLPNVLVGLLALIGVAGSALSQLSGVSAVPLVGFSGPLSAPLLASAVGAAISGGAVMVLALVYKAIRKTAGVGMGDVKLLAVLGIWLGPYALLAFFVAALIGALTVLLRSSRTAVDAADKYPFGPFLAVGAAFVAFVGPSLWLGYLNAVGF